MTTTENHDESAERPDFFQYNNAIKKNKLVSSQTRPQELN